MCFRGDKDTAFHYQQFPHVNVVPVAPAPAVAPMPQMIPQQSYVQAAPVQSVVYQQPAVAPVSYVAQAPVQTTVVQEQYTAPVSYAAPVTYAAPMQTSYVAAPVQTQYTSVAPAVSTYVASAPPVGVQSHMMMAPSPYQTYAPVY